MSSDINAGVIVGRLTADMEIKYGKSGTAIGKFSIASNRSRKIGDSWEEETGFFECTMFGNRATSLEKYMLKGTKVCVQYSLQQERWEKDGQKRSKVSILVNDIQLVGGKKSDSAQSESSGGFPDDDFEDYIPF